ncbi:predicted protein [Plenodomus lingam JN3]|uniref:Predicted protein n=1 Tax=Leptosphaeria maculans (strain JN3 / isolate v23.1.3 / race Av1-4-5-6-7-8) TaxID=985895 RepID=E4ZKD2_LEPMJ|nr:predicted protein [Plenodomus lingam JN3]CBX91727.1 predicted protein [Plenodomus lingam JN3]
MWRTGLLYLDRGDSAIISALRDAGYNTQQAPGSPTRRFSTASSDTEIVWERRVKPDVASPPGIQHWVVPSSDGNSLKFSRPRPKPEDPLDHLSPSSDSTLFEEPPSYSLDQIKEDESSDDYFHSPGLEKSPSFKGDREDSILPQTRRIRHQRTPSSLPPSPSIASTLSGAQRLSRILPSRAKTNDGLLQLQADPTKTPQRPSTGHQRRISLGLPIKSALNALDEPKQLSPPPQYVPPSRPTTSSSGKTTAALIQQERELEYKHRHTFIGTASLDDFLEVLDVTPAHTTTKAAVVRAFLLLASSERLLARQASMEPSGWGLVARTTSDTVNVDYVEQAHAKLGSIVLRQFLDLIPFNEDEEASAISVMEAFSAASHLDTKASTGNGSKAKAFRSWLVRQAQQ